MSATKSPIPSLRHANGNVLAAFDIITNDKDLLQVAFLVANDFLEPEKKVMPFYCKLIPNFPQNDDDYVKHGIDPYQASEALVAWFYKLGLGDIKKIQLIGHQVETKREKLIEWLGPRTFDLLFCDLYRDLKTCTLFLNDKAALKQLPYPVSKYQFSYICTTLGVVNEQRGNALAGAAACMEAYRRLINLNV